jgi:ribosomal protein L11 methyltransferase
MTRYLSLECELTEGREDELAAVLCEFDVLGSQLGDAARGRISAVIYLEEANNEEADRLGRKLAMLGFDRIQSRSIAERDWLAPYTEQARPFEVGRRLWIDPRPTEGVPVPEGRVRLVIEPSMAFGSGTHESTRLALMELEELDIRELAVLDVGTGSGILAIAADALGARPVVALDVDPDAVWVARRSVRQQDWPPHPEFLVAGVDSLGKAEFQLILCNMISRDSIPLLPDLHRLLASDGIVILSGLLISEAGMMRGALQDAGFELPAERRTGEWLSIRVGRV